MLVVDNLNPGYPMDFNKFLGTITGGGGPIGPGATAGGAPAAYYWIKLQFNQSKNLYSKYLLYKSWIISI